MLLGDTLCLEYIGFQFLLCTSSVHHQKRHLEHTLILALQFFQQCFCVFAVGCKVRWNYIHIITGTNCLFLFLDLRTIKLCDRAFNRLDCRRLVNGLNVHRHNLTGFHIQEICQHPVTQVRCRNRQI